MDETVGKWRPIVAVRFGSVGPLTYYDEAGVTGLTVGDRVRVSDRDEIGIVAVTSDGIEVANLTTTGTVLERLVQTPDPAQLIAPTAPCHRVPCCQSWQARFAPSPLECERLFCNARFEPGRYEQMRRDWPAVGDNPLGPRVETEDKIT